MDELTFKQSFFLVVIISLFPFYSFIQMNMISSLYQTLEENLTLSRSVISWLSSSYLFADALFLIPAGIILDNFNNKKIIISALLVMVCCILFFTISSYTFVLITSRILMGAAHSFALIGSFRLASIIFKKNKHAFFMGLVTTLALLGGISAQYIYILLIAGLDWKLILTLDMILGLFIAYIIFKTLPNKYAAQKSYLEKNKEKQVKFSIFLSKRFIQLGLCAALLNFSCVVFGALWGIHYLIKIKNISPQLAPTITSMLFLGFMIGSPLLGLSKFFIRKGKNSLGILSAINGILLLVLYYYELSALEILIIFFCLGLCSSGQVLAYPAVAHTLPKHKGFALACLSVFIMLMDGLIQVLSGYTSYNEFIYVGISLSFLSFFLSFVF